MIKLLVGVSIVLALLGASMLSQATMGAGIIALACLVGILARMMQSSEQQYELLQAIRGDRPTVVPPAKSAGEPNRLQQVARTTPMPPPDAPSR